MDLFAVAGRPVLHSLSPVLFNAFFAKNAIASHYGRLAAGSARDAVDLLRSVGLSGLNVTAPFKTDIAACLDALDPAAERIGAVNTVVARGKTLAGYNTDHLGVSAALDGRGVDVRGRPCLVVGAGGAGRAAIYALTERGASVTLINRDRDKAQRAARALGCSIGSFDDLHGLIRRAAVVVLAVPSGAVRLETCPFPPGQMVIAADYTAAAALPPAGPAGPLFVRGEEWLVHQARPALDLFLGGAPPSSGLEESVISGREPVRSGRSIALVGFMGSGKSTVGRALAGRIGYDFLDMDEWIERQEGWTIGDIFAADGEAHFRRVEKAALARWAPTRRLVMACGGGIVLDDDNRRLLKDLSLVVWLFTSPETALGRMDAGSRPLLERTEPLSRVRELFHQRRDAYFRSADLVVGNEGTAEEAVSRIHEEIRFSL